MSSENSSPPPEMNDLTEELPADFVVPEFIPDEVTKREIPDAPDKIPQEVVDEFFWQFDDVDSDDSFRELDAWENENLPEITLSPELKTERDGFLDRVSMLFDRAERNHSILPEGMALKPMTKKVTVLEIAPNDQDGNDREIYSLVYSSALPSENTHPEKKPFHRLLLKRQFLIDGGNTERVASLDIMSNGRMVIRTSERHKVLTEEGKTIFKPIKAGEEFEIESPEPLHAIEEQLAGALSAVGYYQ